MQISPYSKDRVEIMVLREHNENYFRPFINGIDINNIRKYPTGNEKDPIPWGYQFYQILDKSEVINKNQEIIIKLIEKSYKTGEENKKLKVNKDNHHLLENIFNNSYPFE